MAGHAVVKARAAGQKAFGLRVVFAEDQAHEFVHQIAVEPGRPEGVFGHQPTRTSLPQALKMPTHLVGPGRDLESERDRRAGLSVSSPGHRCIAVVRRQRQQRVLDRPQIPPRDRSDLPHDQREPGVGDVLNCCPDVDVLARRLRQDLLQSADQAQRRVFGQPGLTRDIVQIEQLRPGVRCDRRRRLSGDDAQPGLRGRQSRQDVQPALQPRSLFEHPRQFSRTPLVPVLLGVAQAGAHAGSHACARADSASEMCR